MDSFIFPIFSAVLPIDYDLPSSPTPPSAEAPSGEYVVLATGTQAPDPPPKPPK